MGIFKSIQWNIGAGKLRDPSADPISMSSYALEGLESIIETLHTENPDIITLQEVHSNATHNQVATIAAALGYNYVSDFYSESHIEKGQQLGQGIISRFPLSDHISTLLTNPQVTVTWKNGATALTHDKGLTSCIADIDGIPLALTTLHLVPFDPFKIDPTSKLAKQIFLDTENKLLSPHERLLIQGDLNLGKYNPFIHEVMPKLKSDGIEELVLDVPTIPFGERPDRIMYKGIKLIDCFILDTVLTDHYPLIATFEL